MSVAGGRPVCPEFLIGIDMGGTNIRAGAIDPSTGHELIPPVKLRVKSARFLTSTRPHELRELLVSLYANVVMQLANTVGLSAAASEPVPVPVAIGIGTPGQVDNTEGTITGLANYPEWGDEKIPIRKYLKDAMAVAETQHRNGGECTDFFAGNAGVYGQDRNSPVSQPPIFIFDDANCALSAEIYYGKESTKKASRVVMLTLGTGVGVGYYYQKTISDNNENVSPRIRDNGTSKRRKRVLFCKEIEL